MDRIIKYIDTNQDNILRDLKDLVAVPSESDDHEKVKEALRLALKIAEDNGLKAYSVLDEQVGIVELGEGPETLGIVTHVDVVPAGDPAGWNIDPYDMQVIDGNVYGRGTLDDKGLVISSIYAMKAIKDLGLPIYKKIQLIIGTQEEVEWTDMDEYVKNYPLPDYGFTPDGSFPICNIEKGYIDHTMEFDVNDDAPEGLHLVSLDIGTAANVVPGKAIAVLSNGEEVTVLGKQCHSSQPEMGINALLLLGKELSTRNLSRNKMLDLLMDTCRVFQDNEGGTLGLRSESEYYEGEFVHRNIFTPTVLKAKDGKADLTVNVRFAYGSNSDLIKDTLDKWASSLGGHRLMSDSQEAVFVSKERPFIKAFAEAYESMSGIKNEFSLEYGGTYAKAMPNIVSWGPLFPDDVDTCHEDNEYIKLSSLMISTKIYAEAIRLIVTSEESFK